MGENLGIKINKNRLENEINNDIKDLERRCHTESLFAFFEKDGIQVQIKITTDGDEFLDVIEGLAE